MKPRFRAAGGSRARGGFTLIELLVVLAILATLLTIALPRYYRSVDHSREVALKQTLMVVRDAIDKFVADSGRYPETLTELVDRGYMRKAPLDPITERSDTWILIPPPESASGKVRDLRSGASGSASDGTPFSDF